ncbi:MAG: phosphopantetheine-binding protein [Ignavibacteriaceae bacterium]
MEKEEIIAKVKTIVQPYVQNKEALVNLSEQTDFVKDLKINSANIVDIVLDIESAYNIEIDNDSIEKMLTVGAAIDIINAKINGNDRK